MITIAVDAMGGDHAPRPEVEGSVLAAREFNVRILLVGQPNAVRAELAKHATPNLPIEIVPASEVITMNDHPAQAFRRKKDSSVHVAARLVREVKADGMFSAGNTGAVMTVARFLLGTLESVDRVALAAPFPNARGGVSVLLDVGANVDSRAEHLVQFAVMGEVYYRATFGNRRPRVGLLSVGEEEIKGNVLTREVYTLLKKSPVHFVGNVEGGDLFSGSVDVIVCDGFVGNIALKICEGLAVSIFDLLRKSLKSSILSQVGAKLSQGAFKGRDLPARASTRESNRSSPPPQFPRNGGSEESAMGKVAFVFPGQASQYPGMGRELAEKYAAAKSVFDEADKALGISISKLCFEGTEDELKLTANTQPAILTCSVAVSRVLAEKGLEPDFVAGHSLGEYSALVCAGSLKFADAVRLVRKRGTYMQDAVPHGVGAMAAVMGLSHAVVADACKRAAQGEVCAPANLNSPDQTVISGHAGAVKRAVELASQAGAKRAVILPVSAPFHSALMAPMQEKLEQDLRGAEFSNLRVPLVTNVDADTITTGAEAREALIRQVSMPVRWEESVRLLIDEGVNTFVEVGPGRVLTGLLRQIERSVAALNVEDEKSLAATVERIAAARSDAA